MKKIIWMLIYLLGCGVTVKAQRAFLVQVDSVTRSYYATTPDNEAKSLPLVILLHDSTINPIALHALDWDRLTHPAVVVFPVGLMNHWNCQSKDDSLLAIHDQKFLLKLLFQAQHNFKTDVTRTFLIGMDNAFCVAQEFASANPDLIRTVAQWKSPKGAGIGNTTPHRLDSLVSSNPSSAPLSKKTASPLPPLKETFKPYQRHINFAITLGRWQQAESSRTEFDTTTFVDLAQSHFNLGIQLDYNFTESISVFTDINVITVPKDQSIKSIVIGSGGVQVSGSGHGGIVIPFGVGIRYAFLHRSFRPFVTAAIGATYLHAEGGTGSGNPKTGITQNIIKDIETALTYRVGAGFDYRLSSVVSFRLLSSYFMSKKIAPPVASVDAFRGLSIMTGLAFVLGK